VTGTKRYTDNRAQAPNVGRIIWIRAFGPDDPAANDGPERMRRKLREMCTGGDSARDATDLAGAAQDVSEKGLGRIARIRRGFGWLDIGPSLGKMGICKRNGY
jgi:hypothetical protein